MLKLNPSNVILGILNMKCLVDSAYNEGIFLYNYHNIT